MYEPSCVMAQLNQSSCNKISWTTTFDIFKKLWRFAGGNQRVQGERTQSQPMLLQYNSMYNGPLSSVKSNYMKIIWTFCIHLGVFFLHRQYFFCTSKLFINFKTTLLVFLNFKSINLYFSLLFNASLVFTQP